MKGHGTRGTAISLEVRAQSAYIPQNVTDIEAWKWKINDNIRQTAATYADSLTVVSLNVGWGFEIQDE